ncbi:MAG: hypothetical protein OXQ89_02130 [Rhodospirillaceae bacterium]|nr:hypothetical protein [Rhodospirillaceae bacterium]MDD9996522.1 hypothetical protein [Rhodospirillaceae bacterium]
MSYKATDHPGGARRPYFDCRRARSLAPCIVVLVAACGAQEPDAIRDESVAVTRGNTDDSTVPNRGAVVINETDLPVGRWGNDPFELHTDNSAPGIADGTLTATVSFSGGCARHRFTLVANRRFTGSDPVQIDVSMAHEANDDRCEAYLTETYEFDLAPIDMHYQQAYGRSEGAIRIRLLGPEPSGSTTDLTYNF